MTIAPDQARELLDGATPGPWDAYDPGDNSARLYGLHDERIVKHVRPQESAGSYMDRADGELAAAAPDLAQTIAGMTEEWGVERDRPGTAYIDGTVARWITWVGDEARARKACVISPRVGNPRLVRRLVGPVEVTE